VRVPRPWGKRISRGSGTKKNCGGPKILKGEKAIGKGASQHSKKADANANGATKLLVKNNNEKSSKRARKWEIANADTSTKNWNRKKSSLGKNVVEGVEV